MAGIEDTIKAWVKRAEKTGELKRGRFWGKPFEFDDGFERTPVEHRMAHKVLENAGYLPPEVEMMNQLADLQRQLAAAGPQEDKAPLRRRIAELDQRLRVRLEKRR